MPRQLAAIPILLRSWWSPFRRKVSRLSKGVNGSAGAGAIGYRVKQTLLIKLAMQANCQRPHRFVSLIKLLLFFVACELVYADVEMSGLDDIRIDAWAGTSGSLQGADSYCALSYTERCTGPFWNRSCSRTAQDYNVAAYTNDPGDSGRFQLSHDSSSARLSVVFEWSSPTVGPIMMSDYSTTGFTTPPSPGATECIQAEAQSTVAITVLEADLGAALAGTYSQTFFLDMCRLDGGGNTTECTVPVGFVVDIPELVQVTRLDDVAFGAWTGFGGVQETEAFCVFRNGAGGFALTAFGNHDQNSKFHVQSNSVDIPYTVEVSDGDGVWFPVAPGAFLGNTYTSFRGAEVRDCGGADSHLIRLAIQQSDLEAATPGSFTDTLTVVVEPE